MERLLEVLATPYDHERDLPEFSEPGPGGPYRTFCGTEKFTEEVSPGEHKEQRIL